MKEILLTFLTKKGEEAYHKVDSEGKEQSKMDKKIARLLAKESIISKQPLTVKIKVKIKRLAIASELDKQTVQALEKCGAKKDKDFRIEVFW